MAREISNPCRWKISSSRRVEVICKFAGYDKSQKPWPSKAFLDGCVCFGGHGDLRIFSLTLTTGARILLAYMREPFEVSRNVFDLPALLAADLFALYTATGAGPLCCAQLVYVCLDRKVLEVRQGPPPLRRFTRRNSFRFCLPRSSQWMGFCSRVSATPAASGPAGSCSNDPLAGPRSLSCSAPALVAVAGSPNTDRRLVVATVRRHGVFFGAPLLAFLIRADALELRQHLTQHRFQRCAAFVSCSQKFRWRARSFRRVSTNLVTQIAIFFVVFSFSLFLFFVFGEDFIYCFLSLAGSAAHASVSKHRSHPESSLARWHAAPPIARPVRFAEV